MRKRLIEIFRPIYSRKIKIDQKVFVFIFCLTVSTLFWFLNAFNKEYTTTINYPVRYVNLPKDKILIKKLPPHLTLKINSFGFTILRYKYGSPFLPVVFDASSLLQDKNDKSTMKYFKLTGFAKKIISNQLNPEIKIIELTPDSIIFQFDRIGNKKVQVFPDIELQYAKQYIQRGPMMLIPDSITISGPSIVIDTITKISTVKYKLNDVKERVELKLDLVKIPQVKFSDEVVMAGIPVEKYTENKIKVPLTIINQPSTLVFKMFPSYINVTYLVGLSQYNKVDMGQFRAIVDYNALAGTQSKKLKVNVSKWPNNIISFSYFPKDVEYIIERGPIKLK